MAYPDDIDTRIAARFVRHRSRDLGYKVKCVLAPLDTAGEAAVAKAKLPLAWRAALTQGTWAAAFAALGWDALAGHLPGIVELMSERMLGLGVLLPDDEPPSLLYFLSADRADIVAFEGFPPVKTPRKNVPPDLAAFQIVHDGWYEFYSGELGPMPQEEWEPLGDEPDDLVAVAIKGSNSVGFTKRGGEAFIVWSEDEEVEAAKTVLSVVDDWVGASFEG